MAHFQQLQFVSMAARHLAGSWIGLSIVEIGSANVNGSIRPFFTGSHYTGVDLAPGPDVDLIASGHEVALPPDSVDLAISCECFEHNPMWRETFVNMHRMTKPGGIVIMTCASRGRLEHGTTRTRPFDSPGSLSIGWDYYRNLNREDFERQLPLASMFESHAFYRNDVSKDLYFIGRKPGGANRPLRLDLPALWTELAGANTLVAADQASPTLLRRMINRPRKWAERLPDPMFQNFVIRWAGLEKSLRRVFGGK
ncbi:MAG: class I SAM-dependent methyltransferase [Cyanobacteria bacterium]|nr:class I SAM-dependent methyltransferase [Cyanobacteriota bacterium]